MNYKTYIRSKERKEKRKEYIFNKNGKCEICSKKSKHLHLHHRNYDNVGNEKDGDLILLCGTCHKKIHFIKNKDLGDIKVGLDNKTLEDREEFVKKRRSKDDLYKKPREKKQNQIKKEKIKFGKTNIELHQNIGNGFIEKYGKQTFLDFLEIYKETKNINEIFEIYGIDYDKTMYCSFSGVLGNANNYGLGVDDIIKFVLEYRFLDED